MPIRDDRGWLGPRGSHDNRARSRLPGRLAEAPIELWREVGGSDIRHARVVALPGGDVLLVQAGTMLHLFELDGRLIWQAAHLGVRAILHVGPTGRSARWVALAATSEYSVALLDLEVGRVLWEWDCEGGAYLTSQASSKIVDIDGTTRWVVFPIYSTVGRCFDLSTDPGPTLIWTHEFGDSIDTGFGPCVVVSDVLGAGRPQVVVSSRSGTSYRVSARTGRTSTAEVVQGRLDGHLTQRLLDIDTGREIAATRYRPDDGPYPCARPYGLFTTIERPSDRRRDIMLVSCQVEEYLALTRVDDKGLSRGWGAFVERDWPVDLRELRPQTTSVASFFEERGPELVVGVWDEGAWRTVVVDLERGWEHPRGVVDGMYFWGCHDVNGDGRPEIIVSREGARTPSPDALLALDGLTLEVLETLDGATPLTTPDGDLPTGTAFMAARRSLIEVTSSTEQLTGILVQRPADGSEGFGVWHGINGRSAYRALGAGAPIRVDYHDERLVVTEASGLTVYDASLEPTLRIAAPAGGLSELRAWSTVKSGGLVLGMPRGSIVAGEPDLARGHGWRRRWEVPGSLPVIDAATNALVSAQVENDRSTLSFIDLEAGPTSTRSVRIEGAIGGSLVPYGDGRLLANLTTGVHTTVLTARAKDGSELWSVDGGAHPQPPAAWCGPDDEWLLIADDHGVLRVFDDRGQVRIESDWYASYTMPVAFALGDELGILRGDGIHGIELIDAAGAIVWRRDAELWSLSGNHGALGQIRDGRPVWAQIHRSGLFELIGVNDGALLASSTLGKACGARILAIDVDADGDDEYVVGNTEGNLFCLKQEPGSVRILWRLSLGASVGPVAAADIDGDGLAELVVGTADGIVRILGPRPLPDGDASGTGSG